MVFFPDGQYGIRPFCSTSHLLIVVAEKIRTDFNMSDATPAAVPIKDFFYII